MRHFLPLLAEKFVKTPKHGGFLGKVASFSQIDDFSPFSAEWGIFCHLWLKSSSKRRNTVVASKSWKFWPYRRFFVFFREMRHFLQLLAEKFVKTPKHVGFFEKFLVLAKSTIFRVFSRNEAPFAFFGWKVRQNAETWWFLPKLGSFGQIDDFPCFFTKWGTFCNFWLKSSAKRQNAVVSSKVSSLGQIDHFSCFSAKFATFCDYLLKRSSKRRNTVVASKSLMFWPYRRFIVFPREMRHFWQLLAEKFVKTPKHNSFFEMLEVFAESIIFVFFREMRHFLQLLPEKFVKTPKRGGFFQNLQVFAKSTIFRVSLRNEALFASFWWKIR